jgi:hypothetical protein
MARAAVVYVESGGGKDPGRKHTDLMIQARIALGVGRDRGKKAGMLLF